MPIVVRYVFLGLGCTIGVGIMRTRRPQRAYVYRRTDNSVTCRANIFLTMTTMTYCGSPGQQERATNLPKDDVHSILVYALLPL